MQLKIRDLCVLELWDAMAEGAMEKVEFLLAAGVDPNAQYYELESNLPDPLNDSPIGDERILPSVYFWGNSWALLPLVAGEDPASCMGTYTHAEKMATTAHLVKALLEYGGDPYALFLQHFHL